MVGMPHPFLRQEAGWTFVSVFCLLLSFIILTWRSKCSGETSEGQDFESFIGAEKVSEFKLLFSNWIHSIYHKLSFAIWWC